MDITSVYDPEVLEHLQAIAAAVASSDGRQAIDTFHKIITRPPGYTTLRINLLKQGRDETIKLIIQALANQYQHRVRDVPDVLPHPVLQDVVIVPNAGPSTDIPQLKQAVIVDLACGMAVTRGADIYCQGIMGAPPFMSPADTVSVYADINGKCKKGLIKPFDGVTLFLGNGIAKISRQKLFCFQSDNETVDPPKGVGVSMTNPLYDAPSLNNILSGYIFAQNLPSIVCGQVLGAQPGDNVLDMCAAPGGKTTHIASLMLDSGRVVAMDKAKSKIHKIIENAETLNVSIVEAYAYDATKSVNPAATIEGAPPYPENSYDRILLDAPCSALGQRPTFRNKSTVKQIQSYPPLQKRLFDAAVKLLKPGGVLVYSTCTVTLEENERLVHWALTNHPSLSLESQTPHIGGTGRNGSDLTPEQCNMLQVFDSFRDSSQNYEANTTYNEDTIGFFIAKFRKSS